MRLRLWLRLHLLGRHKCAKERIPDTGCRVLRRLLWLRLRLRLDGRCRRGSVVPRPIERVVGAGPKEVLCEKQSKNEKTQFCEKKGGKKKKKKKGDEPLSTDENNHRNNESCCPSVSRALNFRLLFFFSFLFSLFFFFLRQNRKDKAGF